MAHQMTSSGSLMPLNTNSPYEWERQFQMQKPEQRTGLSPTEQYLNQPIERLFDPNKYIDSLTQTKTQSDKEYKWLSALGYALQLGNPNFKPMGHLRDYKATQIAANEAEWGRLKSADQMLVEREAIKRASALGIDSAADFGTALSDWGILGIDIRKRLIDDFKQFQPDRKFAFEEIESVRAMRKTARADVAALVKDPIKRIKTIEDAVIKVRITARSPTAADRQWVLDNYAIGDIEGDDPEREAKGIRDIALINSYQRMIDPATVREGDVALQRASASWLERIDIAFDRIMSGNFLSDAQRVEMQRLADEFYFHTLRNNLKQVMGGRDVFVSRYTGSTGSKILTDADIDSDFYSKVPKSAIAKWQREYKKGQTRMKASSKERPIVIYDEEEVDHYLPGTRLRLGDQVIVVK